MPTPRERVSARVRETTLQRTKRHDAWFTRSSWGLSFQPSSREGWLIVALHLALVLTWADLFIKDNTEDPQAVAWFVGIVLAQTALLIFIAWKKSEKKE